MGKVEKAIVILNYNTWQLTIEFIEALYRLNTIEEYEIVVVDNASPNDSYLFLKEQKDIGKLKITLLNASANRGYAAGNNVGLKYSYNKGYKYAFVMNTDLLFEDLGFLEKMLKVFEKGKDIAVISPRVLMVNGRETNRNLYRPTIWDATFGKLISKKKKYEISNELVIDTESCFNYRPQGCCMLVDLSKMNEINYMDEETFLYGEESILAERFLKKGYRSVLCLNASIIHNHSQTIKSMSDSKRILKWMNDSSRIYWIKYRKKSIFSWYICVMFNYLIFKVKNIKITK